RQVGLHNGGLKRLLRDRDDVRHAGPAFPGLGGPWAWVVHRGFSLSQDTVNPGKAREASSVLWRGVLALVGRQCGEVVLCVQGGAAAAASCGDGLLVVGVHEVASGE